MGIHSKTFYDKITEEATTLEPQISQRGKAATNSKYEIRISNIEQGISNDEAFLSFGVHYSLFDIQYSLSNGKNSMPKTFT